MVIERFEDLVHLIETNPERRRRLKRSLFSTPLLRPKYRVAVDHRIYADFYLFNLPDPIPVFPIPLRYGEVEPVLPLNQLLHELYDQSSYDLAIDYQRPAEPPLAEDDVAWAAAISHQQP